MTSDVLVISTIGSTMREQGLGVAELRRRLAARGVNISRGALDRLVSERPLKSVNFDLLMPVLDELGISLGEPFVAVRANELERTQQARRRAREASRALANGKPAAPFAALDDGTRPSVSCWPHMRRLRGWTTSTKPAGSGQLTWSELALTHFESKVSGSRSRPWWQHHANRTHNGRESRKARCCTILMHGSTMRRTARGRRHLRTEFWEDARPSQNR